MTEQKKKLDDYTPTQNLFPPGHPNVSGGILGIGCPFKNMFTTPDRRLSLPRNDNLLSGVKDDSKSSNLEKDKKDKN